MSGDPHSQMPTHNVLQALLDDAKRQQEQQEQLLQRLTRSLQDKDEQLSQLLNNQQVRSFS